MVDGAERKACRTAVKYRRRDAKDVFGKILVMHQQYECECAINTIKHEEKLSQRCQVWRSDELVSFFRSSLASNMRRLVQNRGPARQHVQRSEKDLNIFVHPRSSRDVLDSLPDLFIYMRAKGDQYEPDMANIDSFDVDKKSASSLFPAPRTT